MRRLAGIAAAALAAAALSSTAGAQTLAWSRAFGGPSGAPAYVGDGRVVTRALAVDAGGGVVVAGSTYDGAHLDLLVTRLAADGSIAWQKTQSGGAAGDEVALAAAVDASGNAVVAGIAPNARGDSDILVAKYAAADGTLLWSKTFDGGAYDAAYVVAVDSHGDVVVGAESTNTAQNVDIHILKLAGGNGATLWERIVDGGSNDYVTDLALDAAGNAVVTGVSVNAAGNDDFAILKLDAATGAIVWRNVFNGGDDDEPYGVALDAAGNAYVTGVTRNAGTDFETLKLAAADGSIAWQKAYDGGSDDYAQAIAVDPSGNPVVTGRSRNAAGNFDFRTIKYNAATGAVTWQQAFDGGADDFPYSIDVDPAGNVIVAGSSYASGNADWKIIAYAGADGTVLCQRSYAGAANGRDEAYAVVARASGTFVAGTAVESGTTTTVRVEKLAPASASSTGPATLASPAPGSALAGSTVTFTWNDAGAALYQLWVGNSTGAYDIGYYPASGTKQTSTTVTGLPADGRKLYVRLYSNIGGTYVYRDFTYTAAGAVAAPSAPTTAALTSPAPGGTLAGSSVTFQWDNSGASLYQLWIGNSAGGFDVGYYPASGTTQDSIAVTGLPTDGRKLYARLYSAINGAWQYRDFTYTAAGSAGAAPGAPGPASIVSPAAGSTLQGATPVFQWNDAGAQLYQVWVGSSVGADDYGYFPASGTTSTMATATALPIDGRTLYVRLYSAINGAWQFRDFTYRSGP